jgi:hypothetical protein
MAKVVNRGNVTVEFTFEEFDFLERLLAHHVIGGGKFRTISDGIYFTLAGGEDGGIKRLPTDENSYIYLIGDQ